MSFPPRPFTVFVPIYSDGKVDRIIMSTVLLQKRLEELRQKREASLNGISTQEFSVNMQPYAPISDWGHLT
jgi:hypothetical protein